MSYIDARIDREHDEIHVVERGADGQRKYVTYPTQYQVYWPQERGKYTSIFGDKLERFQTRRLKEFQKELKLINNKRLFESDINPIFRCLYNNYQNTVAPTPNVGMLDIEVDFDPIRGYSSVEEAFAPITAISLYCNWIDKNLTLVLKPKHMSQQVAEDIVSEFPDTLLCVDEKELLEIFLDLIDDVDILSGWNSEGYDIPYIHNRIFQLLGKQETRRLCLWNQLPIKRTFERFGKESITYDLVGRVHLDYLQLYRKHAEQVLHSYRLDFVGEFEIGEHKTQYEGSLDALYNNDFKKFIEYNRQDVMLLVQIDRKKKFIELASNIAHTNKVLMATTMGSVGWIDQAAVNFAWDQGLHIPSRIRDRPIELDEVINTDRDNFDEDDDDDNKMSGIAGAYVADPKRGLHKWIGSGDIKSLYPSTIRALNMSLETLVGHVRSDLTDKLIKTRMRETKCSGAEAWGDMFGTLEYNMIMNQELVPLTIDFADGSEANATAAEIYQMIFNGKKKWILSANGTIFKSDSAGIIAGMLTQWYKERQALQKEYKKYAKLAATETDPEKKKALKAQAEFYDLSQRLRKVSLNATYGSLGNAGSRWFDARVAQSVTLSGRCISKHMQSKTNEILTGEYNHLGDAVIYSDTDSVYFSSYNTMKDNPEFQDFDWTKENVTQLYDNVMSIVNESFVDFMISAFNVSKEAGAIIQVNREICATTGLFVTKKRYGVLIYDKEGFRLDQGNSPGEVKAMGLDLKRSDTPEPVQKFLSTLLLETLVDSSPQQIVQTINGFRTEFRSWDGWHQGTPKRANNMTMYQEILRLKQTMDWESEVNKKAKVRGDSRKKSKYKDPADKTIPGHVLASLNWNKLRKIYDDHYSMEIQDGFKVVVCKLRPNPSGITSIAYPVDQLQLPQWFKDLPFDHEAMEQALVDKKVNNLLGVLNWDLSDRQDTTFGDLFSY